MARWGLPRPHRTGRSVSTGSSASWSRRPPWAASAAKVACQHAGACQWPFCALPGRVWHRPAGRHLGASVTEPTHAPVMCDRVVALLAPALQEPGAILVDATVGLGGHSGALLRSCPDARLIGIDRDPGALQVARQRLADVAGRLTLVHAVYDELPRVLAELGHPRVQGVLLDLGVSSMQLDRAERGFAYSYDAPLDMRMDPTAQLTAADVVNEYSVDELTRVLREYGEERFALAGSPGPSRSAARLRRAQSWSTPFARRYPRRPSGRVGTRPSGPFKPCASRSTTSSAPCAGRCRLPSRRWRSAAASW